MKTQLTLAAVVAAGLMASGCSQQMVAQQAVAAQQTVDVDPEPKTIVKTIVDCSKCKKPAAPRPSGNMHGHPAIPGCTDSIKHNHRHPQGGRHSHKYGCKKGGGMKPAPVVPKPAPVVPKPAPVPAGHVHPAIPGCTDSIRHNHQTALGGAHKHRYACKRPQAQAPRNPDAHTHPAIPGCTNSVNHVHPNGRRAHTHKYACRSAAPVSQQPVVNYQQMAQPKMIKPKGTYKGAIKIDGVMKQYEQQ
ncbi:MAG: hypothetical protein ACPG51_03080 [Thiolinea sp.]